MADQPQYEYKTIIPPRDYVEVRGERLEFLPPSGRVLRELRELDAEYIRVQSNLAAPDAIEQTEALLDKFGALVFLNWADVREKIFAAASFGEIYQAIAICHVSSWSPPWLRALNGFMKEVREAEENGTLKNASPAARQAVAAKTKAPKFSSLPKKRGRK